MSGTDDTLRAAFEAAMRDAGWTNVDPGSWFGYRAGYEHGRAQALEDAAQACEDEATIEGIAQRCAARIRALGAK